MIKTTSTLLAFLLPVLTACQYPPLPQVFPNRSSPTFLTSAPPAVETTPVSIAPTLPTVTPTIPAPASTPTRISPTSIPPGNYDEYLVVNNLKKRTYSLHIPPSYTGRSPIPLLILLHGTHVNGKYIATYTGMNQKSDREGFIAVYPDALGDPTAWNVYNPPSRANPADEIGFMRELINKMQSRFQIDPRRIFAVGHSNGAMMAYRTGAELPDLVAAVGAVAGTVGSLQNDGSIIRLPDPAGPVSVVIFHGKRDGNVPYYGYKGELPSSAVPAPESTAFWVQHNRCPTPPQRSVLQAGQILLEYYPYCLNNTAVAFYTLNNADHAWPGQFTANRTPTPKEFSATEIIWQFFKDHPKP